MRFSTNDSAASSNIQFSGRYCNQAHSLHQIFSARSLSNTPLFSSFRFVNR